MKAPKPESIANYQTCLRWILPSLSVFVLFGLLNGVLGQSRPSVSSLLGNPALPVVPTTHGVPAGVGQSAAGPQRSNPIAHMKDVATATSNADAQMISTMLPNGVQQIVLLDVKANSMAVYHIEPSSGRIELKSVRNVTWDLKLEHFNGQSPLPGELKQVQP